MKRQAPLGSIFVKALVVLLIIPLSLVMILFMISTYETAKKSISDKISIITESIASELNSKVESPYRYLSAIADMADDSGVTDKHVQSMMSSGIKSYRAFEAVYLLDNKKIVRTAEIGPFSRYMPSDFIGMKLSGINDVPGVLTTWSRPQTSALTNGKIVRLAIRFTNGYAVADINLHYVGDALKNAAAGSDYSAMLVNQLGDVLSTDNGYDYVQKNVSRHPLMNIRKTGYHVLFGYKDDSGRRIGAIHKLESCDWYVICEEPLYAAFMYYRNVVAVTAVSLLLLGIFSFIVLYFIRLRLIQPLHLLTDRSEMISRGEFVSFGNDEKNSFSELRSLYDSFEKMAVTIDHREKELKDKEEYLRSVFDSTTSTGLLILSMDKEPVITDVNTGAQVIFGYRLTELLGLPASALVKGLYETLTSMCAESKNTGAMVTASLDMVKKDGAEFPVLCSISPLFNFSGNLQGYIGLFTDITEITRVKNELESEKERLDVTLKSIGEGVVAADSMGRITLANSTAESILSTAQTQLAGQYINDVLQIYDYDTGRLMTDRITDLTAVQSKTYRANMIKSDGGIISVYITSSAMKDSRGRALGSVYVFRDITDRMHMEQELINRKKQLEEVNRDLELRVSEETEKRRKNEQMLFEQAKFAAMGQMISAIAHQWRQPLNALALYVQDIEDAHDTGEVDKSYIENFTVNAMRLINHMSGTIDDFRNFFHSANIMEPADITEVAIASLSLVTTQLRNNMINYTLTIITDGRRAEYENKLPENYRSVNNIRINVYPSELKQVLLNILQNARYAIEDQRKTSDAPGFVRVTLTYKTDRLRIDIDNSGGSIPEEILSRIFEPYFTTKPEGEGTGIGLYMSKIMIEDHMNGLLMAENIEDGVRFSITLGYNEK